MEVEEVPAVEEVEVESEEMFFEEETPQMRGVAN